MVDGLPSCHLVLLSYSLLTIITIIIISAEFEHIADRGHAMSMMKLESIYASRQRKR